MNKGLNHKNSVSVRDLSVKKGGGWLESPSLGPGYLPELVEIVFTQDVASRLKSVLDKNLNKYGGGWRLKCKVFEGTPTPQWGTLRRDESSSSSRLTTTQSTNFLLDSVSIPRIMSRIVTRDLFVTSSISVLDPGNSYLDYTYQ